ncbi:hypothetical protein OIE66_12845 [Nonomuraea sp. NBC_01738]|uniref:hypothetical protein n=1 Tax=Nonomuraea sp. NBC_01738 TaxID=2976003 RepID=UPI002E0D3331|nr:hypothetical protein OIE66_12845 [Nonomuraea sp. NBC_01738]
MRRLPDAATLKTLRARLADRPDRSWSAGHRGDLAYAVYTGDGDAAPATARFLAAVRPGAAPFMPG